MKKLSTVLSIVSLSILILTSVNAVVFAQDYKGAAEDLAKGSPISSPEKIIQILNNIVRYTYIIFFIVAVFFILVAAFTFLTAQADPEKIKNARSQILWAVVAIAIALLSVGASKIITSFISNP